MAPVRFNGRAMHLSALHVYPIKSCAALSPMQAEVQARGLAHDRRWMIVDDAGRFITGRQAPRLVLIRAQVDGETLTLSAPDMPVLRLEAAASARLSVIVWRDRVQARAVSEQADAWLSRLLGRPCRLVYMDEAARRPVNATYARPGDEVSFADGFPLLLISQASLDALNARLDAPVPMLRFRPNLVVAGTEPHAEDRWTRIRIGEVELDVVKPCTRCVFTTVVPEDGTVDPSGEPLRTLRSYRRSKDGVTFGQNLIARGAGTLHVGASVTIVA